MLIVITPVGYARNMSLPDETPFLTVTWCDRCGRPINAHDEPDHSHSERCSSCMKFVDGESPWGHCRNHLSPYCGRVVYSEDTCKHWYADLPDE